MEIRIGLAGNPNCGKTTMFNNLTGSSQYVGNWPGVTVEKKEGKYTRDKNVLITDLPGVYSLSPYSPEEIVTRDFLLEGGPDVVVNLVDATSLERNLYLTTQILDLGVPVVVALNMMDLVEKNGTKIDVKRLSQDLGCPVIETSALRGRGMEELIEVAKQTAAAGTFPAPKLRFDQQVESALDEIAALIKSTVATNVLRWYSIKLFEGEERTIEKLNLSDTTLKAIDSIRETVEDNQDDDAESIITSERYNMITHMIADSVKSSMKGMNTTQKIDRVVTNRWLGLPLFIVIMTLVYYLTVSTVGTLATDWANDGLFGDGWLYTGGAEYEEVLEEWEGHRDTAYEYVSAAEEEGVKTDGVIAALSAEDPTEADEERVEVFIQEAESAGVVLEVEEEDGTFSVITRPEFEEAIEQEAPDPADYGLWIPGVPVVLGQWLEDVGTAPWLQSLILDGVLTGVGAVLGFVPQMIVLFLLLSLLEGCGYMARVAFIMDRIFRKFGLSGKSFIPMLIASGCAIPAIMATKTIESERDRRMTVITTSFIPCSAKLPIIALVFGAIAGGDPATTWWVAPLFYFLGVLAIIVSGIMLRKTKMFAGQATPFVMELPQYHLPAIKNALLQTWERVKSFIVRAGTVIFIAAIVIWFLLNFGFTNGSFGLLDPTEPGYISNSLIAVIGSWFAWLFAPLGFGTWEAAVTSLTGLVAKENVVSTLAIITNLGDAGEGDVPMWTAFSTLFANSTPAIMAFCAFNLLCAPCFAAIGAIRRQMQSARWTWFAIGYQTVFAWVIALMIYQFASVLMGTLAFNVWTGVALVLLLLMLFQIFRPMPKHKGTQKHDVGKEDFV